MFARSTPPGMDDELFEQYKLFWGAKEIQEFWSGDACCRADEGQEFSYYLAQLAVNSLSQEYDSFIQFTNKSYFSDGGESAVMEDFGGVRQISIHSI